MCCQESMKWKSRFHQSWPSSKDICKRRPKLRTPLEPNMTITVQIPTALRRHTAGAGQFTCAATNLGELFSVLDHQFPELKPHLRDEAGQVRRFLNVYVNEEDIRFLGGNTYSF